MSGFGSGFHTPFVASIPGSASAGEIASFRRPGLIKGYTDLTFDGEDLILTGNLTVEGSISASGHTSDGTSASNLGDGAESFALKVNNDLQFRSLKAGANITINQRTDVIEVTGTGGGAGNPAGNNTTIQYNDDSSFNGSSLFTFNNTTDVVTLPDVTISGSLTVSRDILPLSSSLYSLGSTTQRFANVYTGDLHLQNERGNWTIYEEPDMLVVVNNRTGKKYKMHLIPLEE